MAIAPQEVWHICRFCLCPDEGFLIPLEDILDFALCVQDVATLTGIQITKDNIASYFMCLECTDKMKSCINFRKTCLSNDGKFQELCGGLAANKDGEICSPAEEIVPISDSMDESSDFDINFLESIIGDPDAEKQDKKIASPKLEERKVECPTIEFVCSSKSKSTNWENPCKCQSCMWKDILMPEWEDSGADVLSYSANYIPSGEIVYTEPAVDHRDWQSINPPAPPPIPHPHHPGKRKLHLCDLCGLKINHIKSHMVTHATHYTQSCPYCDVKAKNQNTINEHIRTVHMKIARKKCNICGRKFIHHKTYRYHMLSHEGKTFECPDCLKTFSNAIYLRDHINRLHNAGKLVKKKSTKDQKVRRKRQRSKTVIEYEEMDSEEDISAVNAIVEQEEIIVYEEIDSRDDIHALGAIVQKDENVEDV